MTWGGSFTSPIPATRAARASVAQSATAVVLFATNAAAVGRIAKNETSATMYVCYGSAGSAADYTEDVAPGDIWKVTGSEMFAGPVYAIWSAAGSGFARTTEMLP